MRRTALLLAVLAAFACASTNNKKDRVALDLEQIVGASTVQAVGRFDVRLGLGIRNDSTEPVTLKHITLTQIGTGSYQITTNAAGEGYRFNETIAPGATGSVEFWVHAYQRTLPGTFASTEPVAIRTVAYFESPSGPFHQVIQKTLGQFEQ
jgi:hypothetical protein